MSTIIDRLNMMRSFSNEKLTLARSAANNEEPDWLDVATLAREASKELELAALTKFQEGSGGEAEMYKSELAEELANFAMDKFYESI